VKGCGKVKPTLIEKEVVIKAKESGLNLSKTCKNAFKEAIRRLKGLIVKTKRIIFFF